jgi:hypothetical protein
MRNHVDLSGRKRNTHIHLLLSNNEKKILDELMKKNGLSQSAMFRYLMMERAKNENISV